MSFADPVKNQLVRVSPTIANDLLDCPFRVAWRLDPRYRYLRRPTPGSELGRVAHAIVEEIGKGLLRHTNTPADAKSLVEDRWNAHVDESVRALAKEWHPSVPPAPEDWPGFFLTRTRVLRRALRFLQNSDRTLKKGTASIEKALADPESGIYGRPDRIEEHDRGLCIVDLKTGLGQAEPTVSQRRQLLIYAFLTFKATKVWPATVAVEDASGRRWQESIDTAEVTQLIDEISDAREAFNIAARTGDVSQMARPEAGTCKWCPYRSVCKPYWESFTTEWDHGSVAGTVQVVESVGDSTRLVRLLADSPGDTAGETWILSGLSAAASENFGVGTEIVVTGAEITETSHFLRIRWSTILRAG